MMDNLTMEEIFYKVGFYHIHFYDPLLHKKKYDLINSLPSSWISDLSNLN